MVALRMTNEFDEMIDHAVDMTSRSCVETLKSRGWSREQIATASGAMRDMLETLAAGLQQIMIGRLASARKADCKHMAAFAVAIPLLIAGKLLIDSVGNEKNH